MVFYYVKKGGQWWPRKVTDLPYNETASSRLLRTTAITLRPHRESWTLKELTAVYPLPN